MPGISGAVRNPDAGMAATDFILDPYSEVQIVRLTLLPLATLAHRTPAKRSPRIERRGAAWPHRRVGALRAYLRSAPAGPGRARADRSARRARPPARPRRPGHRLRRSRRSVPPH